MMRTILYFLLLAVLGTAVYFFVFRKDSVLFQNDNKSFTIKDTSDISRIFLASNSGETILLERRPGKWQLNKQFDALPSLLTRLMTTLATQEALYPANKEARENVLKGLSADGIKVEVYDLKGKKRKVFYVGGATVNGSGTYMLQDGSTTPHVVQIPLFNGSIRNHFTTALSDWRDRTVFDIPADQIKAISVQYPDEPLNSYTITKTGNNYSVEGAPEITGNLGPVNTTRTDQYFGFFTNINCEGFLNGLMDMDSTIRTAKLRSRMEVTLQNGTHKKADIYWMWMNRRSKNMVSPDLEVSQEFDSDRMYAVTNDSKDTVLIQIQMFRRLLRKAYEFYDKGVSAEGAGAVK